MQAMMPTALRLQSLCPPCCLIVHATLICSKCGNGHCQWRRVRRVHIATGVASALSGSASGSSSPQSASAVALSACLPGSSFLLRDLHKKEACRRPWTLNHQNVLELSFAPQTLCSG